MVIIGWLIRPWLVYLRNCSVQGEHSRPRTFSLSSVTDIGPLGANPLKYPALGILERDHVIDVFISGYYSFKHKILYRTSKTQTRFIFFIVSLNSVYGF